MKLCLPHLTHFTNMIIYGGVHQMSSLCLNDIRVYDIPKPNSALTFSKHRSRLSKWCYHQENLSTKKILRGMAHRFSH